MIDTKITWFQFDGRTWCWVKDGESQSQAHHVSGAIFLWDCTTNRGMGYMCKIKGKMTQALYLRILRDGVMKIIEWYHFQPFS